MMQMQRTIARVRAKWGSRHLSIDFLFYFSVNYQINNTLSILYEYKFINNDVFADIKILMTVYFSFRTHQSSTRIHAKNIFLSCAKINTRNLVPLKYQFKNSSWIRGQSFKDIHSHPPKIQTKFYKKYLTQLQRRSNGFPVKEEGEIWKT